ncbi:hypothetical protein ACFRFQ_11510 [Rhodococcus sp. NPDC056743]|uniref:maleate cis-trans isomerase family protein n=1 Tax=Rhodococcus sp. NPDC056743 TaxID=3345934 RepID=UPI003672CDE6
MSLGFGHITRIGHLYPSGGLCDYELQLMAPDGVQFITTRLPFATTDIEGDRLLVKWLESYVGLLADAQVDIIALNCTAATMLVGPERLKKRIYDATGIEAVTTIEAVMAALATTGVRHPALLTPYPEDVVEAEVCFLRSEGIEVVTHLGMPRLTPVEQAMIEPGQWRDLAATLDRTKIDGLLVSCAGVRIADEIESIERQLDLPVITSNQALLWHLLETLRIPERPRGYGSLLAGLHPETRQARVH